MAAIWTLGPLNLEIRTLFAGGRLCLDFVNTLCLRRGVELEFLYSVEALEAWLREAEGVYGMPLLGEAALDEGVLLRCLELRLALRHLVDAVIQGRPVEESALEAVNAVLRDNASYSQIGFGAGGFRESLLAPDLGRKWMTEIAKDAVSLLCQADHSLIRECECSTCIRVFFDTTKNKRRKWCVEKCANRSKAAARYRRKLASG